MFKEKKNIFTIKSFKKNLLLYISLLILLLFFLEQYTVAIILWYISSFSYLFFEKFKPKSAFFVLVSSIIIMPSSGFFPEEPLNFIPRFLVFSSVFVLSSFYYLLKEKGLLSKIKQKGYKKIASALLFFSIAIISFIFSPLKVNFETLKPFLLLLVSILSFLSIYYVLSIKKILNALYSSSNILLIALVPALFEIFSGISIYRNILIAGSTDLGIVNVIQGTQGLHLTLAIILLFFIPIFYLRFKDKPQLFIPIHGVLSFVILHTYSRSAFLALIFISIAICIDLFISTKKRKTLIKTSSLIILIMIISLHFSNFYVAFALRNNITLPNFIQNLYREKKISHTTKENLRKANEISISSREESFKYAINSVKKYPFLGVGYGQFEKAAPDSLYNQIIGEMGILGIFSFLLMIISAMFYSGYKSDVTKRVIIYTIIALLIAGVSIEIVSYSHSALLFWTILAMSFLVGKLKTNTN